MGKLMHKTTSKSTHISVFEFPAEEPHVTFTDILIISISLTHFKYLFFLCVCEMFFFRFFFFFYLHRFNTDVLWNKFQLHLCLRVHLTHINSLLTAADRTEIKTFFCCCVLCQFLNYPFPIYNHAFGTLLHFILKLPDFVCIKF